MLKSGLNYNKAAYNLPLSENRLVIQTLLDRERDLRSFGKRFSQALITSCNMWLCEHDFNRLHGVKDDA